MIRIMVRSMVATVICALKCVCHPTPGQFSVFEEVVCVCVCVCVCLTPNSAPQYTILPP